MLQEGDIAPNFIGKNQHGETRSSSDFKGKNVILYFYPKDNTPGCTAEACSLNNFYDYFAEKGFTTIGVSADSIESHQKFAAKYSLSFDLISDPEKNIIRAFGAWGEKKNYGKSYMGIIRSTFILSPNGIILKVFPKVVTKTHAEQIIKELNLI
jgi:thioredoxin-dependent peroxiredoxin